MGALPVANGSAPFPSYQPLMADAPPTKAAERSDETLQAEADRRLTTLYADALKRPVLHDNNLNPHQLVVPGIPRNSSFGQWRTHLHDIVAGRAMQDWAAEKNIDLSGRVTLDARSGTITSEFAGRPISISLYDFPGWPLLISAAKALTPNGGVVTVGARDTAAVQEIGFFYGKYIPIDQSTPKTAQKALITAHADQVLEGPPFTPVDSSNPFKENLSLQKTRLGDFNNRRALSAQITGSLVAKLGRLSNFVQPYSAGSSPKQREQPFSPAQQEALKNSVFTVDPASSYFREHHLSPGATVSLHRFMVDQGIEVPTHYDQLVGVARALSSAPPVKPALADLGGALSGPTLLSNEDQRKLHSVIRHAMKDKPDDNVLTHWTRDLDWEPSSFDANPRKVLSDILGSSKARWMGHNAEATLGEIASPEAMNDWMLAALQTSLDKESVFTDPPISTRTHVAGFDLANPDFWGKDACTLRSALSDHLIRVGKATPLTAPLAVFVLLSRKQPGLLVKEIPAGVKIGSHTWVSFSTAVARIEAQAPGSTSQMTYAQVMMRADVPVLSHEEQSVELSAKNDALKDWGVANGIIVSNREDVYTAPQMDAVYQAYSAQVAELSAGSKTFARGMPTLSKMALDKLRRLNPQLSLDDLQAKCLNYDPRRLDKPGPYSVLDLYLSGRLGASNLKWTTSNDTVDPSAVHTQSPTDAEPLSGLVERFQRELQGYFNDIESAVAAQTKNLISTLPLHDRQIIENGQLSVAKERRVVRRNATGQVEQLNIKHPNSLIVHVKFEGKSYAYAIDSKNNTVYKREDLNDKRLLDTQPSASQLALGEEFFYLEPVVPSGSYTQNLLAEKSDHGMPNSYFSERTKYIADARLKTVDIRAHAEAAKGKTTFDTEGNPIKALGEFFLNLIPLYSAINNFSKGNVGEGIVDLALDAMGFFVGLGAAAKGAKALKAGASAFKYFRYGAKILGRGALGALNPLDGIGALVSSAATGGKNLAKFGSRKLTKWTTPEIYDAIKALKGFDSGAIGTARIQGELVETLAAQRNGKWFAVDPITQQPYGLPLKDFLPSPRINVEEFGKWATAADPGKKISDEVVNEWKASVIKHRGTTEFDNGYYIGAASKVPGLDKAKKIEDIMKLSANKKLNAEQIGIITKKYDDIAYQFGRTGAARFIDNIEPRFGSVIPMPQVVYLTQTLQLSDGQCAALSRVMANAMAEGKEAEFIKNLYTAAAFPTDPASRSFVKTLSKLQTQVGSAAGFHAGKIPRQISYQGMIKELNDANVPKSIMIDSPGHAMAAGVKLKDGEKTFWFYDPNFGLATFSSAEAMEGGLKKLFHDKKLNVQYKTHGPDKNNLQLKVSDHDDFWMQKNSVLGADVNVLYDAPLTPSGRPRNLTNEELKFNWEKLHAHPDNQGLICYQASARVGQAEKTLSPQVYDAMMGAVELKGGTNYSPRYLELMGIKPDRLKTKFNPDDITESGLLNFKYANEGGDFAHTVYIQKTSSNELFLFNTNSPDLDLAMIKSGSPPQISGAMTVYALSDGKHKGLQDFLDGLGGKVSWQYAYTPASTLNATVQKAQP
ncbi:YopT-type cysteine protease domain-containing protein [Pseudomonas sp. ICMP 460]|uniref:YopT-type cysteine protease domain-containing protein n=1 Tax=Pseudomonas sp. ICMP 460 TaxID=1718917 RepID=UPI000C079969|nr:YopT-type cysteine protease domain-containing protein [Pseudomonas sp. ICMP 460]PHN32019.1 hypothetical protein AO240_08350 [Pseudomonas sp. ICMP 460]